MTKILLRFIYINQDTIAVIRISVCVCVFWWNIFEMEKMFRGLKKNCTDTKTDKV